MSMNGVTAYAAKLLIYEDLASKLVDFFCEK